jgi:hypothetical protein
MDNFDLKKFLVENKLTRVTSESSDQLATEQGDLTGISKLTFSYAGFEEEGVDEDVYGNAVFKCDQYPDYYIYIGASGTRVHKEQDVQIYNLYFEQVEGFPKTTLEL